MIDQKSEDLTQVWSEQYTPEEALDLLESGRIDSIQWGVETAEAFERAKRHCKGNLLCVRAKHPKDAEVHEEVHSATAAALEAMGLDWAGRKL